MSGEIPSLVDLQNTKVRIDHFAELIDGTLSGTSTNPITGITYPTYEKAIKDLGFKPGSGSFTTGFTINPGEYDVAWYDPVSKNWYSWGGALPHTVAPGTNPAAIGSGYVPRTDVVLRSELESEGATISDIAGLPAVVENMHSINAANYGVVNNQSIDQTSALNSAISAAIAIGARYVQLDYDIKCTGEISGAGNVILTGNGSIDSSNRENYGIYVSKGPSNLAKINSSSPKDPFAGARRAIQRGTINVVVVGDSICTPDPNTITGQESLSYYLEQKLKSSLKGVTVNFYNRAIGGATFEAFDAATLPLYLQAIATANAKWYTDFNQPWMSYVSSLNPDIVVVGFGMNGENTTGQGYTSMTSVLSKLNAISSAPSLAFITTPTPTANHSSNFGKYAGQSMRNHFAELVRSVISRTRYIIDVNRAQQVACHGIDPLDYCKVETLNVQTGVTTESSAATVFNTNSRYFSAKFDLMSSTTALQIQWGYNPSDTSYNNSIIITNTAVLLYTNTTVLQTAEITTTLGEYNSFSVHVDRNAVSVTMNDTTVFSVTLDTIRNLFDSIVLFSGGPTKKNVRLFEFQPARYAKTMLSDEAWGPWTSDSSVGTKALIGGNSVNHPSSLGLAAFYKPAIDELIEDLKTRGARDTIYNTPIATGAASLITGKKFSDYSYCIFVFGNDSIGVPMCQVVPREVLVAGYRIQELQRNSSGTFAGLINVDITSDTGFTVSRSGTTLNQLGLIIGIA